MKVTLKRISYTENETYGVLTIKGHPVCVTLERPWLDNKQNVSCIPEGYYACSNTDKVRVVDVKGRTGINIEVGNYVSDTKGCILVGESFREDMILNSSDVYNNLREILPKVFLLEINGGEINDQ